MIIHDLADVSLSHADILFVDCDFGDVQTLALRATEQGCAGFQFNRDGNGLTPIFCTNKLQWMQESADKNIVFVSDQLSTARLVQVKCPTVTVYYFTGIEPPDSHLFFCPLLLTIVCMAFFCS